jgi:tRNA U34 5-carboxymethylaminomethyl modifying enzyme MnmG/GidA
MSTSFSQAVEALTAQARTLVEAASSEVDALREELEQERRFRRHLEATAAARAHEWAARQEEARQEKEQLEAVLAEALEGRRLAEEQVERFHEAVREQLAIAEREQAAQVEAEQERERQRQEAFARRLQEAAEAAVRRQEELQEAAALQREALLQELELEQQARLSLERRLSGVRQAVLDLLLPTGSGDGAEDTVAGEEITGRGGLRKILVPRPAGQGTQPALS